MKLSTQQVDAIRRRIEERAVAEAVIWVQEGQDLDYGRVSRMEWIATGKIVLDAESIDALLCDGAMALDVRAHVDDQVRKLTEEWLETARGLEWLEAKVEESLAEELEQELERMQARHVLNGGSKLNAKQETLYQLLQEKESHFVRKH